MALKFIRNYLRDGARDRGMSVAGAFAEQCKELSVLAIFALKGNGLTSVNEVLRLHAKWEAEGLDMSAEGFGFWLGSIVAEVIDRLSEDDWVAMRGLPDTGMNYSVALTRKGELVKAAVDLLCAVSELYEGVVVNWGQWWNDLDEDVPPPPTEEDNEDDLGPPSLGELFGLAAVIGYASEVLRRHEKNGDLLVDPELERFAKKLRALAAGKGRGKQREVDADEKWRIAGLQLAKKLRLADPRISQENIARQIQDEIDGAPQSLRGITKVISEWEGAGQIPPKPQG